MFLVLAASVTGCAARSRASLASAEPPQARPAWPAAPDEPRIVYVRELAGPEDLGIRPRLLDRIVGALAGSEAAPRLIEPMAVVESSDGCLYVADPGAMGIHRFDLARGRYALVRGPGGAPLPSPVGLAAGKDGRVFASDSALGRLLVIEPKAKRARFFAAGAALKQPTGLATDPETGRLWVVDTADHRVKSFDADGTPGPSFGERGGGPGAFNYPTMIFREPDGALLVTDSLNFRVQRFDASGTWLASIGTAGDASGTFARPKGVAVDRFGHVYVVDGLFSSVQVFDRDGRLLLRFGERGSAPGEFWLPTGLAAGGDGTLLYVADTRNRRVQVFQYVGAGS